MASDRGTLRQILEVDCRDCERSRRDLTGNARLAGAVLKAEGWAIRSGVWYCPRCPGPAAPQH